MNQGLQLSRLYLPWGAPDELLEDLSRLPSLSLTSLQNLSAPAPGSPLSST